MVESLRRKIHHSYHRKRHIGLPKGLPGVHDLRSCFDRVSRLTSLSFSLRDKALFNFDDEISRAHLLCYLALTLRRLEAILLSPFKSTRLVVHFAGSGTFLFKNDSIFAVSLL